MLSFLVRRLAILAVSLVGASLLVFCVLAILPGDEAQFMLGTQATPDAVAALQHDLGLDVPAPVRYVRFLAGLAQGDLGTSHSSHLTVASQVAQRMQVTLPLAAMGMLLALAFSVPAGIVLAIARRSPAAAVLSAATQLGIAVPAFWAAILLITVFAVRLHWFPAGGFTPWAQDPLGALDSLLLPALSLAIVQGAILTRYVRTSVLDVMREDFIRTARAKGLTRGRALRRHGLPNAAIPVVTVLGLQFGYLLVGAIIIENVFYLPGLGRMLFQAIGQRDLPLVQGTVMVVTAAVLLINFATDVSYRLLDPRLRSAAD